MSDVRRENIRSALIVGIALMVALVGGALLVIVLQNVGVDPDGPVSGGPTAESMSATELIRLRNLAVASLENANFAKSNDLFTLLADQLPGELLAVRNLAISRIWAIEPENLDRTRNPEQFQAGLQQAELAVGALLARAPNSPTSHVLAARLAGVQGDEAAVMESLRTAAHLAPRNPAVWCELYLAGRNSENDVARELAVRAIDEAHHLRPDNLFLLMEYLSVLDQRRDPRLIPALDAARDVFRPFAEKIQQLYRVDLQATVDAAVEAAKQREPTATGAAKFDACSRNIAMLGNLLRPEIAQHLDRRRVDRHILDYVVDEFSDDFKARASLTQAPLPEPIPVSLARADDAQQLPALADARRVQLADFDLDGRPDVIVLRAGRVEIYGRTPESKTWYVVASQAASDDAAGLVVADFDRDAVEGPFRRYHSLDSVRPPQGRAPRAVEQPSPRGTACYDADVDVLVYGPSGLVTLRNHHDEQTGLRSLIPIAQEQLGDVRGVLQVTRADLDHDGDLDLVVSSEAGLSLWSNRDDFTFEDITDRSALPPDDFRPTVLVPVDWDRNVMVDVLLADPDAETAGYMENIAHGRFRWRPFDPEFAQLGRSASLALLDADGNASWDLVSAGPAGVALTQTNNPDAGVMNLRKASTIASTPVSGIATWDYDNDGYQDLVAWHPAGIDVYRGHPDGEFAKVSDLIVAPPADATDCQVGDIDGDGDIDLLTIGPEGVVWYSNHGGNANRWIDFALRADSARKPQMVSFRVNMHGIGSLVELKVGRTYQARVVTGQSTHFGLGQHENPDALRILWTNGAPNNIITPPVNRVICEQQVLLGSCPYIYTWTGEGFTFFSDCLWAAPIGLQFADGVTAPCREWEYLKIPGDRLVPTGNEYRIKLTEELWEAAYFDSVRLLAVDHPADVEIYSNEKVGPPDLTQFKIYTVREPRLPVAARDKHGREVLSQVAERDDVYLRGFDRRLKQGLVDEHFLELDLGELDDPERIVLFLTGWIYPTSTSLNLAIEQDPRLEGPKPPSVWVPDAKGNWTEVMPHMGFPGGKTKTITVDLSGRFPADDYRVRIATSMEIYWDSVFFTVDEPDAKFRVTEMPLVSADLSYRGFSRRMEHPQYGPERYGHDQVSTEPTWPPMGGCFTRYGDVTELIAAADDRQAVLGAGDAMMVTFRVTGADLPAGWTRDFILHNVGYDKDADLNTIYGQTVEPLPFREQQGYPDRSGHSFPDSPAYREYLQTYQTRRQNRAEFWNAVRDFQIRRHNDGEEAARDERRRAQAN